MDARVDFDIGHGAAAVATGRLRCASAAWCRGSASVRMSGGWRCATISPALP